MTAASHAGRRTSGLRQSASYTSQPPTMNPMLMAMAPGLVNAATRGIDQVDLGLAVVQKTQQESPGQERRVRLPIEPMQGRRQILRGDAIFLCVVEAAAVHGPQLAANALTHQSLVRRRQQVVVEPDEIKRGADPGNARDQVHPTAEQA